MYAPYELRGLPVAGGLTASGAGLAQFVMWMAMASGAIVLIEPAPYDLIFCGLLLLLPALGVLRFTPTIVLAASAWLLIAAGGFVAGIWAGDYSVPAKHTAISLFLSSTAVLVAAYAARNPPRHGGVLLSGMAAGGLLTAVAGILGYFSLMPGAWDLFTEFGRARALFKDPNVYGPFMVPGLLCCVHVFIHGSWRRALAATAAMALLLAGLLVSFSRGAWFNTATALAVYGCLVFVMADSNRMRLRLAGGATAGLVLIGLVLGAILQVPEVLDFLKERAALLQEYDAGPNGRFAGQAKALELIAQHPLGIGALEFSRSYHPEDVHNVYLSMFLNAGWLGGFLYAGAVLVTLFAGLRACLTASPVQGPLTVAVAAFAGLAFEGLVIDSDHWRHFYVIMGLIWGLLAAVPARQPTSPRKSPVY